MPATSPSRIVAAAVGIPLAVVGLWFGSSAIGISVAHTGEFMPHGYCYLWDPAILWLNVISDALITLSYYCIPIVLIYFIHKTRDLPFNRIFWMFGTFILACGTTHLLEIWNVWHAHYLLAGVIKAVTAAVSVLTAAMLIPLVPKVISLPGRVQLEEENRKLEREIAARKRFDAPVVDALRRRVTTGFIVAMMLTVFIGISTWHYSRQAEQDAYWISHTHEVMETIQRTSRHVIEAETSARAFSLTGEESLLTHYRSARETILQDEDALRHLTADNPDQQRRIDLLQSQVWTALEFADNIVARRKNGVYPANKDAVEIERRLDLLRGTTREMYTQETQLLSQRTPRIRTGQQLSRVIAAAGVFLGVLLWVLARLAVNRQIDISARAQTEINTLNAELEDRVRQRTTALRLEIAERQRAEESREQTIRDLADQKFALDQHAIVATTDVRGTITYVNKKFCAISQYSKEELIGQNHRILNSGHHPREFFQAMYETIANGHVWRGEICNLAKDGSIYWVDTTIVPLLDGEGKPRQYMEIRADITERRRIEEARERLAAVVESSGDAIIGKDLSGIINAWNCGAEKLFGYAAAEVLGKAAIMLFPPDRANEEADILARIGRGESVDHFETVRVHKDGTKIDVSVTISPIRGADGAIVGASKIARDITERKRTEEILRQSNMRRRFALDTAKLGDWELDLRTMKATRSLLHDQIFGHTSLLPEWSFEIFMAHIHPDDRAMVKETFEASVREGKRWEFECRIVRPNGETRWIWACGGHYLNAAGEATQVFGIVGDITERKQSEEALREQARLLDLTQVLVRDQSGRILQWTGGVADLYGYTREDAVGRISHELLQTRFPEPLDQIDATLARDGYWEGELVHRKRDGSEVVVVSVWVLHRDAEGRPLRVLESNTDVTGRKRAEEALRDSEQQFLAMANGIPQLAWMAEPDGHIFWYNQRWYEYTGTTFEQMEGWAWQSVHDPEMLPKVMEQWKAAIATATPFQMEFPLRGADGKFREFLTRVNPLKDPENRVVRWFGTNTDISERKDAELRLENQAEELSRQAVELVRSQAALESQTRMFKLVLESMGEGLVAADRDGHFLLWNNSASKLLGRGETALEPEKWSAHYACFDPDGITPVPTERLPLVRALHGESLQAELLVRHGANKQDVFLEFNGRPMRDDQGGVCGGVVAFRDITARKQAEAERVSQAAELSQQAEELSRSRAELESQQRILQSVLDSMAEGLVATDQQGKFILWNPAAERIVGLGPTDMSPEQWNIHYGVYRPDTVTPFPPEENPLLLAIRGQSTATEMFLRNRALGDGIWIEATANPLRGKDGALHGGVIAFRDVTERKTAEREIRKLNQGLEARVIERTAQLQAANQELEAFTYSVSHDLRAPLRHISGFSKLLSEEFGPTLPPEAQHHVQRIQEGTRRMGMLVDDLLNLARVGRRELTLQVTGLKSIIDELIQELAPESEGRKIEWKIGNLPFVECDPGLIKQVFQNLLANALKFTRPRPVAIIEIGQKVNGDSAVFVRDNGVGFSMKYSDKLFGVFQRLHRAEDFEGTGVGLATVQRIIKKHGGRIWAEAELDKGATFYFTIGASETESKTKAVVAGAKS